LAIDDPRLARQPPQRHVERGPVLGDVDVRARKERGAARLHPRRAGEIEQQRHGRLVDPLLGEIVVEPAGLKAQPPRARRIGEKARGRRLRRDRRTMRPKHGKGGFDTHQRLPFPRCVCCIE